MKVVILAGGLGTRISEESHLKPKPMIEIGGQPILWHIMKMYGYYGFNDFIICCGYKGYMIKEYFNDYFLHTSDVTFDFREGNRMIVHKNTSEPWRVTLVDTGINSQTGCRVAKVRKHIGNESFMLTYGDGVSNVDIPSLLEFHNKNKTIATITAIQPGGRFGVLDLTPTNKVKKFSEKAIEDGGWINGGFMVLEPGIFDYISERENCVLETEPMVSLARDKQLMAYKHSGFWQCMDTMRDRDKLEVLWNTSQAPWKLWE